ncbi:MAG: hypothetical protein AB3N22_17010 [Ruegeria sp.]
MVILTLTGCEALPDWAGGNRSEPVIDAPDDPDPTPTVPDVPDAETPEPDALAEQEVSIGTLGRTVASLGNAAEPGLWLKTPLVSVEQAGRVYYAETNTTVDVTLIPIDGPKTAGSRLSLGAMQALGAPLTGLPEVDVFGA